MISRVCQSDIPLKKGVTHNIKVQMVMVYQPNLIKMRVFNHLIAGLNPENYNPEEEWLVYSLHAESPMCMVRHSAYINYQKKSAI